MTEKETTEVKRVVKVLCVTLILTFFGATAYAQTGHDPVRFLSYHETGIASWYGKNHRGRLTYSGDHFDPQALTCAHKTLPMQTIVRVTNVKDGKSVICRVNDRGPFVRGRVVDLSEHAAEQLGVADQGIAKVLIEVIRVGDNSRLIGGRWKT